MRNIITRIGAIAGAALALAGCGGEDDKAATNDIAPIDANMTLDAPTNDASAMESATGAAEPSPATDMGNQGTDSPDVLGETSGGDTGGNTVESNVSSM